MCLFTYTLLDKEALVILVVQVVLVAVEVLEDLVGKIVVGKTTTRTMAES